MKIKVHNPNKLPLVAWRDLVPLQETEDYKLKEHTDENWAKLWTSINEFGFFVPFYVWLHDGLHYIIDGHQRKGLLLLHDVANEKLPALVVEAETLAEAKKKLLVITSQYGTVTPEGFAQFTAELPDAWVADTVHFDALELALPPLPDLELGSSRAPAVSLAGNIAERFIVSPFSVLDARSGVWQTRKRAWMALGLASQEGREAGLTYGTSARPPSFYTLRNEMREEANGVDPTWEAVNEEAKRRGMFKVSNENISIFDPVLTELLYRWFNLPGGTIVDPFAGGSVRGIVAACLGMPYAGVDLRPEQVAANVAQWQQLQPTLPYVQPYTAAEPAGAGGPVPEQEYGPHDLTPVLPFAVGEGVAYAKREDFACYAGPEYPSGSKVRQFMEMIAQSPPGTPLVVGCSAHSAQQIYIADAARRAGVAGVVFVPQQKVPTAATAWAQRTGADVRPLVPGYPSQYRKEAREYAKSIGGAIRWDVGRALRDTAEQCENLPADVRRVIVPTGSGLTAAGIVIGLAERGRTDVTVVAVAVSPLAKEEKLRGLIGKHTEKPLPALEFVAPTSKYEVAVEAYLPDGSRLDPLYAAKALPYVQAGDCLWISGVRPVAGSPAPAKPKAAPAAPAQPAEFELPVPQWAVGDSRHLPDLLPAEVEADLVFSCPPYADLEVYSNDPNDLSTMDYPAFITAYREIIKHAVARLKPNRFACFIVGEVRDPQGRYRNFVGDTIAAFEAAGASYYNEIVLVTAVGSLAVRITRQFQKGRKIGKTHQNVLVFFKGDPKTIRATYGDVVVGDEGLDLSTPDVGEGGTEGPAVGEEHVGNDEPI